MKNETEKKLEQLRVKDLSAEERDRLWRGIRTDIRNLPSKSYNVFNVFTRKPMVNIALILLLIFGGSIATVSAADNAKPGDILFPIDRAIEDIQLKLSSDKKKTELKLKFALERVEEVEEIVGDVADSADKKVNSTEDANDSATTTEERVEPSDNDDESHDDDERVEVAYSTALEFLAGVRQDLEKKGNDEAVSAIDSVIERLDGGIDSLKGSIKLKVENEKDKYKFELKLRDGEGKRKIKIEVKDDEVEIESESDSKKEKHEDIDGGEDEEHEKIEKKKDEGRDEDEGHASDRDKRGDDHDKDRS